MYDKLPLIQLAFAGKDKWHGKEYKISKSLNKGGDHLEITSDVEADEFRWILFYNEYTGQYHLMAELEESLGGHLQVFSDGVEAMQHWIDLLKKEKYGFQK